MITIQDILHNLLGLIIVYLDEQALKFRESGDPEHIVPQFIGHPLEPGLI